MSADGQRSEAGWSEPGEQREATPTAQQRGESDHPFAVGEPARYQRNDLLGEGGMGVVHAARDRRLDRTVAYKEVAVEADDSLASRRLAREAWITARLEHPNIVSVYDAGCGADGRLYYTMRMVRGRSLADVLADHDDDSRLDLLRPFLAACQALAFAHDRGIVHRDVKPANIMVGAFGETQVVDWGLAAEVGDRDQAAPVVGTPGYRSPEQEGGAAPDPAADVWSLGMVLLDLLGEPSAAPVELLAIAEKATSERSLDRYPTAEPLARDVGDYLDGRRVSAHEYRPIELIARVARAWRGPLIVAGVALLIVAVIGIVSIRRMSMERSRAVRAEAETNRALQRADETLGWALDSQAVAALLAGADAEAEVIAAHALSRRESADARGVLMASGASARPLAVASDILPPCDRVRLTGDPDVVICVTPRSVSAWQLSQGRERWRIERPTRLVAATAGRVLMSLPGSSLLVVRLSDGSPVGELDGVGRNLGLQLTPDGSRLYASNGFVVTEVELAGLGRRELPAICQQGSSARAMAVSVVELAVYCDDGSFRTRNHSTGALRQLASPFADGADAHVMTLRYADDGGRLLAGTVDGRVAVLDIRSGRALGPVALTSSPIIELSLVSEPDVVAVQSGHGAAGVWRLSDGVERLRLPVSAGRLARIPGGATAARELVTVGRRRLRWTLPEELVRSEFRAAEGLADVTVADSGDWLAAARGDGAVSVWSLPDGRLLRELEVGDGVVKTVDGSPDGGILVAGAVTLPGLVSYGGALFDRQDGPRVGRAVRRVGFLRGGIGYAVHYGRGLLTWESNASEVVTVDGPSFFDASTSPDRSLAVLANDEGGIWTFDGRDLTRVLEVPTVTAVAISDTGVVVTAHHGGVRIHGLGERSRWLESPAREITGVAVSPDASLIAAATRKGTIELWRSRDAEPAAILRGHRERVSAVKFVSSSRLASAGWDGSARLWDLGPLEREPAELIREAERRWGLALDQALAAWRP